MAPNVTGPAVEVAIPVEAAVTPTLEERFEGLLREVELLKRHLRPREQRPPALGKEAEGGGQSLGKRVLGIIESRPSKPSNTSSTGWLVHEYAAFSTVHGVSYLFARGQTLFSRSCWVFIMLLAATLVATITSNLFIKWTGGAIETSLTRIDASISSVDFPTITICADGRMFDKQVKKVVIKQVSEYLGKEMTLDEIRGVDPDRDFTSSIYDLTLEPQAPEEVSDALAALYPEVVRGRVRDVDGFLILFARFMSVINSEEVSVAETSGITGFFDDAALYYSGLLSEEELAPCDLAGFPAGSTTVSRAQTKLVYHSHEDYWMWEPADCIVKLPMAEVGRTAEAGGQEDRQLNCLDYGPVSMTHSLPLDMLRNWVYFIDLQRDYLDDPSDFYFYQWDIMKEHWATALPSSFYIDAAYKQRRGAWVGQYLTDDARKEKRWFTIPGWALERDPGSPDEAEVDFEPCMVAWMDRGTTSLEEGHLALFRYRVVPCDDTLIQEPTVCRIEQPRDSDLIKFSNAALSSYDLLWLEDGLLKDAIEAQEAKLMEMEEKFKTRNSKEFQQLTFDSSLPCYDKSSVSDYHGQLGLLMKCLWKEQVVPCQDIFVPTPTDNGMCCSFNADKAMNIYRNKEYAKSLEERRERDKRQALGLTADELGVFTHPDYKPEFGVHRGLTVFLDSHTNEVALGSLRSDSVGFRAFLGRQTDYPRVKEGGIILEAGRESRVGITAKKLTTKKEDLELSQPDERNCYFEDEYQLKGYVLYSKSNCLYECQAYKALEENNNTCLPEHFTPMEDILPVCDYQQEVNFLHVMKTMNTEVECRHCLSDCSTTIYSTSVSSSKFRECNSRSLGSDGYLCNFESDLVPNKWGQQVLDLYHSANWETPGYAIQNIFSPQRGVNIGNAGMFWERITPVYDAYDVDIAKVDFFFASEIAEEYSSRIAMTFIDFMSQVGGIVGLFMGFSVISLFELVYWFTYKAWAGRGRRMKAASGEGVAGRAEEKARNRLDLGITHSDEGWWNDSDVTHQPPPQASMVL